MKDINNEAQNMDIENEVYSDGVYELYTRH